MFGFRIPGRAPVVASLTLGLTAAMGVTGLVTSSASAQAGSEERGLRLVSTADQISAYDEGDGSVYFEPAVWLAAYGQGYEFRATRDRYADPVSVTKTVVRGTKRTTVPVPARLVDGFNGFRDGLTTTVRSTTGQVLQTETQDLCPGGWDNQRVDPSGPSDPVYPSFCSASWFTRSTVFGIEQGWAVRASSFGFLQTKKKQFDVTISVSDPVADFLGIPAGRRSVTQHVVVSKDGCVVAQGCRTGAQARRAAATSDQPASTRAAASSTRRAAPATSSAAPASDTVPDLVSVPAWGISTESDGGSDRLDFNANEWNAGPAPMVVEGYRRGTAPIMDAYQVFYRKGKVVSTKKTGTMEFHEAPEHHHWHFLDFARYDLVTPAGKLVTTSGKQSWCLAPTDPVDLLAKNAVWRPEATGLTSTCGDESALWLRETMPVGWGDTYSQYQTQAFDLTGVPNGKYQIKVTVNPNGNLFEKTRSNNVSLRTVKIGGKPGARTVTVPAYQGVDTENFFDR